MNYTRSSFKFILHKSKKSDKEGYVYLQKIKNRDRSYESLNLPKLHEKFWNSKKERVRELQGTNHVLYNQAIESKIKVISSINNYSFTPSNQRSYITFFKDYLNSESLKLKHGSRRKYSTVLKKLSYYLGIEGSKDLIFSEFNLEFLEKFQNFLIDEKKLQRNSIIHYLKIIRLVFNKALKTEGYYDIKDPFVNFSYLKKEHSLKEHLTKDEIKKIINKEITIEKLNQTRNLFLIQLFSKGMRVSDLMTLRLNNFVNGRIQFKMFKTNNTSNVLLSNIHIELMQPFINFPSTIDDVTISKSTKLIQHEIKLIKEKHEKEVPLFASKKVKRPVKNLMIRPYFNLPYFISLKDKWIQTSSKNYWTYELLLNQLHMGDLEKELSNLMRFKEKKGVLPVHGKITKNFSKEYNSSLSSINNTIKLIKGKIEQIHSKHLQISIDYLTQLGSGKNKNNFVFKLLKDEDFKGVNSNNDFSGINDELYYRINKTSVVYNRNLKKLQNLVGINKTLKSHLARVSYTNQVYNIDGIETYDIMKELSHSSLAITNLYLQTGFVKESADQTNSKFIDQFN